MTEVFGPENFSLKSVFQKQGGNFNFEKNVEFLEFFGFTLCFRTFQAQKNLNFFPTRLIEKFRFIMIFDYQSEIVNVFQKKFVKGCILKYYLQNMRI